VRGCFAEAVGISRTLPPIYEKSIVLEKLLSSNDSQIVRYILQDDGRLSGIHRPLSNTEQQGNQARNEIERGMMAFVDEAIEVRKNIFHDFCPPLRLPEGIFVAFVLNLSRSEKNLLQSLVLDDFYCGQGLV
jgi:hypothetical protein